MRDFCWWLGSDSGGGSVFAWGSREEMVNKLKMKRQKKQENLRLPEILKNAWMGFRPSNVFHISRGTEAQNWHLCIAWEKSKIKLHVSQKKGILIKLVLELLWNKQNSLLEFPIFSSYTLASLVETSLSTPTSILVCPIIPSNKIHTSQKCDPEPWDEGIMCLWWDFVDQQVCRGLSRLIQVSIAQGNQLDALWRPRGMG